MRYVSEPHPDLTASGLDPEVAAKAVIFENRNACHLALHRALAQRVGAPPLVNHICQQLSSPADPHNGHYVIAPPWEEENRYWSFREMNDRGGTHDADELFLNSEALTFISHNGIGAFGPMIGAKFIPAKLARGANSESGPRCILARYLHRVSVAALVRVSDLYRRVNAKGKVVAVHVRLGDAAMHRECAKCVAPDEPAINEEDRITIRNLRAGLEYLNTTLAPGDAVIVMSDTRMGLKMARRLITSVPIFSASAEKSLHSTQITGLDAANSLLSDFVAMSIADKLFRFGSSSLSGCAGRIGNNMLEN